MIHIFNRLVQNDFGWQKPSPGRRGSHGEGKYVQENGFGHEDWNFNCDLTIDEYVYGYCYYSPAKSKLNEPYNVAFGIYKYSKWYIVGFYENATFVDDPPVSKNVINRKIHDLRMLGDSLGQNFSRLNENDIFEKISLEAKVLKLKIHPENIYILDNPIELPRNVYSSKNYRISTAKIIEKEVYEKIKNHVSFYIHSIENPEFPDGRERERIHKIKERNTTVVKLAKEQYFNRTRSYKCEICEFDFYEVYGDIGYGYIEAHHIKPVSEFSTVEMVTIDDFVMLCSNCHKMIHRRRPWLSYVEINNLLLKAKTSA